MSAGPGDQHTNGSMTSLVPSASRGPVPQPQSQPLRQQAPPPPKRQLHALPKTAAAAAAANAAQAAAAWAAAAVAGAERFATDFRPPPPAQLPSEWGLRLAGVPAVAQQPPPSQQSPPAQRPSKPNHASKVTDSMEALLQKLQLDTRAAAHGKAAAGSAVAQAAGVKQRPVAQLPQRRRQQQDVSGSCEWEEMVEVSST